MRRRRLVALVLIATALLYWPALYGEFVGLDDYAYVVVNPDVRDPVLLRIFDLRNLSVSDWTPLVTLTHAVEYRVFGLQPLGYHATNIVLHLICVWLVYALLRDLALGVGVAAVAALVFAIHPLQVESVAWVASRKNLLAAAFGLAFCRAMLRRQPVAATLLLLAALCSKGTAVVFPLWMLVLVACGFGTLPRRRAAPWLALFCLLALGRAAVSITAQAQVIGARAVGDMTLAQRLTIAGRVLAVQARQFVWPHDLSMDYLWSAARWSDGRVIASWLVVIGVIAGVGWLVRRDRRLIAAAALIPIGLAPTMGIVPTPDFQADRYAYVPLIGAAVLTVQLLVPLQRIRWWLPRAVLLVWCALVLVPAARDRIAVWRTTETMWHDALRHHPRLAFAWDGLGRYYLERGDTAKAERALRRALKIEPALESSRYNLTLLLANTAALDDALAQARQLVAQHPAAAADRALLGELLVRAGALDQALQQFDVALQIDPGNTVARYQRGQALLRRGRLDDARVDFEHLLRIRRTPAVLVALGTVALQDGDRGRAAALAREAAQRTPRFSAAWLLLSQAAADPTAAIAAVRDGLAADPSSPELRARLRALRGD